MKKKVMAMLLCAAMAVTMLGGCGSAAASEAGKVSETEAGETEAATEEAAAAGSSVEGRTTFTVGFDAEFPPYGFKDDNGEYTGFDLDLAQEVCDRLGWELVKQPVDWDAKDMELSSGAIDCIWNGFTMNGREEDYTWSVPYVDNSQVFVVGKDSGIAGKADLAGKIVGVQKESSALAALEEEDNAELAGSFADLVQYADYNTAFMDLEAGAIDAVAMDIGVANYQIGQRADSSFVVLDEQLSTEQYGIGFLKGNTELKDTVEATLMEMVADGTFQTIAEKYADFGIPDSVCLK